MEVLSRSSIIQAVISHDTVDMLEWPFYCYILVCRRVLFFIDNLHKTHSIRISYSQLQFGKLHCLIDNVVVCNTKRSTLHIFLNRQWKCSELNFVSFHSALLSAQTSATPEVSIFYYILYIGMLHSRSDKSACDVNENVQMLVLRVPVRDWSTMKNEHFY